MQSNKLYLNFNYISKGVGKNVQEIWLKKIENDFFGEKKVDNENSDINIVAHRGYSSEAPENTLPAFIAAAENGYDAVECDINWTKDGVPVLLHDNKLQRTSNINLFDRIFRGNKCSHYTLEELKEFDFGSWKGKEFKGTKIPTFSEALDCANQYDLNLYVELKENDNFNKEKAKILVDQIKASGMEDKITWISFNSDYLNIMSELMPEARIGYLSKKTPDNDTIEILEELQNGQNEVFLDIKASKMTEKADNLLDEAGFEFEAWTVDDLETLELLNSYGCSGITTDEITQDIFKQSKI